MALKVIESIIGIFDDVTGRLAAISPAGTSDVSYVPTSDTPLAGSPVMAQTDPVTGGLKFTGRANAEIIKSKIGRVPLRVSGIGNSIMFAATPWFVHSCDQSNGLLIAVDRGHGVPGNNTSQMLARATDVPASADIVFIMEDTNSASSISNLLHAQNMRGLIEFYLNRGQLPVVCRAPSCTDNTWGHDWNRIHKYSLISYFVAKEYDVPCLDPWRIFTDETTGKLSASAGAIDGVHPDGQSQYLAGIENLSQLLGQSHSLPLPVAATAYDGAGLIDNPLMTPAWDSYGTGATKSLVADASIPGSWTKLTGSAAGQFVAYKNMFGAVQAGDVIALAMRIKAGGGTTGAVSFGAACSPTYQGGWTSRYIQGGFDGAIVSEAEFIAGSDYAQVSIYTQDCTDGRYIQIAQCQAYNKTALLERSF